jgi:integrase
MYVKFFIRENKKQEQQTIRVRVRVGREIDISMATKETTLLGDWDSSNQCCLEHYYDLKKDKMVKKRDASTQILITQNKEINHRLYQIKRAIEDKYKCDSELIDRDWLKAIIYPEFLSNHMDSSFLTYCNTFIASKGSSISKDYITKVNSIKAIIERYMSDRGLKILSTEDIDSSFKNDFEKYCKEVEKYSNNYIEKNFKFIKTILYHAKQNGLEIYSGLSNIKGKSEKTTFEILTQEDLDRIEGQTFENEHLETAKDWLLISCYCGQRVSDFMKFDVNKITQREVQDDKRYFIEFTQQKTKKQLLLPLHNKIIEILKKRDWRFPRKMSSSKYNLHIKEVCKMAGIDEVVYGGLSVKETESNFIKKRRKNNRRKVYGYYPKYKLISSHIGRRTFASLNFGRIPTPLLMVATGHSTPNMLMKYIGKIDEQQSIALAEYL